MPVILAWGDQKQKGGQSRLCVGFEANLGCVTQQDSVLKENETKLNQNI